jgi:hypothetical protein
MTEQALEQKRAYQREWNKRNREKVKEYQQAWKSKNKDKVKEYQREWNRKHPDKVKEYQNNYWSKKAAAGTTDEPKTDEPNKQEE